MPLVQRQGDLRPVFAQAAAPADTLNGNLWVDTDDQVLSVANGSSYSAVVPVGVTQEFSPAVSTFFETAGRFTITLTSGGANTFGTNGLEIDSSSTISSAVKLQTFGFTSNTFNVNSRWFMTVNAKTQGTDYEMIWCMGSVALNGAGITFTGNDIGFKSERASSGTVKVSATNGDGTETETDIGVTDEIGTYYLDVIAGTSAKFFRADVDDAAYTLEATHTTNLPTGNSIFLYGGVSNIGVASQSKIRFGSAAFQAETVA